MTDWNCSIVKLLNFSFDRRMNTISVYLFRLYKPQVGEGGISVAQISINSLALLQESGTIICTWNNPMALPGSSFSFS